MEYIYRYIDESEEIKYVGIVWKLGETLDQRIAEHKSDWWYTAVSSWKIEYMEMDIINKSTAEALESHYISKFNTGYTTGNGFNKSKDGCGEIKIFDVIPEKWIPYSPSTK